ncbi:hypothetical protein EAI26_07390 [Lactobacillus sp. 0.1XD8-4]|uniref:Uncharacterized protein n=1 Tax=Limosilactobacillus walteri TaxID=2268022 RepID=A0ABR8P416_9LACO|nr:hypothetical protein [Limosilactobacillus walteri]MBD5805720.1 hypothetical protein [Limosilactobacillus walteri]MRN07207.1 hypothetical protein [Lactobacillus sp. 0.1XD8-4]
MSKYDSLWQYIRQNYQQDFTLTFDEIEKIAGIPLDHSFLRFKKELVNYGFTVEKISLKKRTVKFNRL